MQIKVFTYLKSVLGLFLIGAIYLIYYSVTVQKLFSGKLFCFFMICKIVSNKLKKNFID